MRKPLALAPRFPVAVAAGILMFCTLVFAPLAPRATAGPFDLKPFAGNDVRDLTLDATEGTLYFNLRGINYLYRPPVMTAVSLADLTELILEAETLLIEETNPRRTEDHYNGQTARVLSRILVRPCQPARR